MAEIMHSTVSPGRLSCRIHMEIAYRRNAFGRMHGHTLTVFSSARSLTMRGSYSPIRHACRRMHALERTALSFAPPASSHAPT